jgi:hypothetical protein
MTLICEPTRDWARLRVVPLPALFQVLPSLLLCHW